MGHAPLGIGVDFHVIVDVRNDLLAGEHVENAVTSQNQELILRSYLSQVGGRSAANGTHGGGEEGEGSRLVRDGGRGG